MALRWATLFVFVFATVAGSTLADDTVKLVDETGKEVIGNRKNGVITWWGDESHQAVGSSSVNMGALSTTTVSQVVSFTVGHPPALKLGVRWDSSDNTVDLVYPPVYTIPIKFWILCAQAPCDDGIPAAKKGSLARFLLWANRRLREERVGVSIVRADAAPDHEWISNKTGSAEAKTAIPRDFAVGTDCGRIGGLPDPELKLAGAFNVYMVETVDNDTERGDSCGTDDSVVVGRDAIWGTILHELGHDLSLGHIEDPDVAAAVGGQKNLMAKVSTSRKYLSEGQVFRMHFSIHSGLTGSLSIHCAPAQSLAQSQTQTDIQDKTRDCDNDPPEERSCPGEDALPWGDQ